MIMAKQAYIYKKMCEASDIKLRQYLKVQSNIKTEMEIDESNSPELHVIDFFDFNTRDDLLDENCDDDDDDDETENIIQPNQRNILDNNESEIKDISRTPNKSEEFLLVDRAKIVDGRYLCEICQKTLAGSFF